MTRDIVLRGIETKALAGYAFLAALRYRRIVTGDYDELVNAGLPQDGVSIFNVKCRKTCIIVEPAP